MRKIREVLRLKAAGLSDRRIAAAIGSARSTVQECLRRAREADVVWPLAEELDEDTLQARLYRREVPPSRRPLPDFSHVHTELNRPGARVSRSILPGACDFCRLYLAKTAALEEKVKRS